MNEIKTTEEMRELFTDGGFWSSDVFDAWLAQHNAEIIKATEKRIIKLLESKKQHEALAKIDQSAYRMNLMLDLTIALIEREQPVGNTDKLGENK